MQWRPVSSAAIIVVPVPLKGSNTIFPGREYVSSALVAIATGIPAPCVCLPTSTPWPPSLSHTPNADTFPRPVNSLPDFFHTQTCSQSAAARLDCIAHGECTRACGFFHMRRVQRFQPAPRKAGQYSIAIGYSHGSFDPTISCAATISPKFVMAKPPLTTRAIHSDASTGSIDRKFSSVSL